MRIGIDVSWAQGPPSGTATYVTGLVEALVRVGPHNDYVLFTRSMPGHGAPGHDGSALPGLEAPNVRYVAVDASLTNVRQQVTLSLATEFENYSVFKPGDYNLPALDTLLEQVIAWSGALATLRSESASAAHA